MAQQARQTTAVAISRTPPATYKGTEQSWKVLTEAIWPTARSADSIMLALSYCASRGLDPFKRPVHIVPVYNSTLRREVETVWPGISELLTVASRSKEFAGVDEPREGPIETRTFSGTDRDGDTIKRTVTFPLWCSVTVYRIVGGVRVAFSSPVYWLEAYARQGFRSEIPNDMWTKRPHGQVHKCALAASLRLGFPEDIGGDYSAEEMEGATIAGGGVTIDHEPPAPEREDPPRREARVEQPPPPKAPEEPQADPDPLNELNGTQWLKNLDALLTRAASEAEVVEIAAHPRLRAALETAPTLIVDRINTMLREAHERVRPVVEEDAIPDWPDPIADLRVEIEAMDLATIDDLRNSSAWKEKTKHLIPPDWELLEEAIAARRATLQEGNGT